MSNIFSTVETLSVPRSKQKMSFRHVTTYGYGKLYPCFALDCVPSDTIKIHCASVLKAFPMVAPNMTPGKLTIHFWFVPYRLLDDNFTAGVRGFDDSGHSFVYQFPKWTPVKKNGSLIGTLWDYFGLPINVKNNVVEGVETTQLVEDETCVDGVEPSAYLKRAYNYVFNTMYRNENTRTTEVDLDSDDIQYRCWRADYFTKALPMPQKPFDLDSVFGLPISFSGDIPLDNMFWTIHGGSLDGKTVQGKLRTYGDTAGGASLQIGKLLESSGNYGGFHGKVDGTPFYTPDSTQVATSVELSSVSFPNIQLSTFDQSDFRLWMQLQKWAERNNRGGSNRYDEFIKVHFAIQPQDARLQLPEFLGGIKTTIAVADDFAQAGYSVGDSQVPQGNRVGVGGAAAIDKIRSYNVQEFGCIIGIASILPQAEYMQGVEREWIKHDSIDFFRHEFCCLSDQEVFNGEVCVSNGKYVSGGSTANLTTDEKIAFNRGVFGYQGIYDYMRFKFNRITGQMRTLFGYWHQARTFNATADFEKKSQVNLNNNFVEARGVSLRPFVQQDVGDCFYVKNIFQVEAYRPCTARAIPGLADHF